MKMLWLSLIGVKAGGTLVNQSLGDSNCSLNEEGGACRMDDILMDCTKGNYARRQQKINLDKYTRHKAETRIHPPQILKE